MNQLISLAQNNLYKKQEDETFKKYIQVILLIDEPIFSYTNEGEISRQRGIKRVHFTASEKQLEGIIKQLTQMLQNEEKDLK